MITTCTSSFVFVEILKVLPTAIVGAIAAYIAWRQAQIAKEQKEISSANLNRELFDRRITVFETAWGIASKIILEGVDNVDTFPMTNLFPLASFLFKSDVGDYLNELNTKIIRLRIIVQLTKNNSNVVPHDLIHERAAIEMWIGKAASEGIRNVFAPYLDFAKWQ